ncbi:hypothetical protein HYPSUDRAFT_209774 [Hypholoma sublateritium FD-334 SS-4]|uniref:Uncharacterized protein n=1 Tax=Hypholoma sublateritium (strain FD-334 SS-4) TaxID=945553 RepID=A0A0D2N1V3_HYPSF|nr:hypothetical protein HYPSUDRAFT_209774 [Hypholoma sublateritium FD-334 SS-4]
MNIAIATDSSMPGLASEDADYSESCPTTSDPKSHRAWLRQLAAGVPTSPTTITSGGGRYSRDTANSENYTENSGDLPSPPHKARPALSSTAHSSGGASYHRDASDCESRPADSGYNDSLERGSTRNTHEPVVHEPIGLEPTRKIRQGPPPDPTATSSANSEGLLPGMTATKATNGAYSVAADMPSITSDPIPGSKIPSHYDVPHFTASSQSEPIPSRPWPILAEQRRIMSPPGPPTHPASGKTANDNNAVATKQPSIPPDILGSEKVPTFVVQESSAPTKESSPPTRMHTLDSLLPSETQGSKSTSPIDYCAVPAPPILTPELISLGEAAVSTYEDLRSVHTAGLPPHESDHQPSPLSSLSREGIERYYNALVDAREAIRLRRLAVTIDIGECLKVLDSKLNMYCKDGVFLSSAAYEVKLKIHPTVPLSLKGTAT